MHFNIIKIDSQKYRDKITKFWENNFTGWHPGKLQWFYSENIFGQAISRGIFTDESDDMQGMGALFPRDFFYKNKKLKAGITGDFGVSKNHRILGPALKLQKKTISELQENNFDFLYGFPNKDSEPVQRRAGFQIVGSAIRLVKVLNSRIYLQKKLKSRLLAYLAAPVANFTLQIKSKENRIKLSSYLVEENELRFDKGYDILWENVKEKYKLIGVRNKAFLEWRFAKCPYIEYKLYGLRNNENKEVAGYIIYYDDGKNITIVDCLAKDKIHLAQLFGGFIRSRRKAGFDAISVLYLGDDDLLETIRQVGFVEREDKRNVIIYINPSHPLADELKDKQNWYFFEADND